MTYCRVCNDAHPVPSLAEHHERLGVVDREITMDIKRIAATQLIPDSYLDGAADGRQIIASEFALAMEKIEMKAQEEGREIDWKTLDLRFFRDVHTPPNGLKPERDPHLTLRVLALTKP